MEQSDYDSAIGDAASIGDETDTQSLASSAYDFPIENGREYHKYHPSAFYPFPNDDHEQDRLDRLHHSYKLLRNALHSAPIEPTNVLDVGTGTGIWAVEMADHYPQAIITGVDLSPIQPEYAPPNCNFELFDHRDPWSFPRKFDLVYARDLLGSIPDPEAFFQQAYQSLAPGGWIEIQDTTPITTDDNSMPQGCAYRQWIDSFCEALSKIRRDAYLAEKCEDILRRIGFIDVRVTKKKLPCNGWAKDKKLKELGVFNNGIILDGLEALSFRLFTYVLGWSPEQLQVFLAEVRKDVKNISIHAYTTM
ncbi:hypothetical protein Z517_06454 [Fonsecaea pedrosoi CBS 271.37]|uniref:Methyltransferase domain-containing protein n=1 Tax=Fonsecaea pedrosoi CBS 271.37 TaxID=1442368 RepID=A0A0D2H583_9EURO|nr:uncharacterized protein Z517_06454 [Fonsecaea pedrosoi CBS 271.37]KIW79839.1 hypothetical protein Z517_06454 [Fonsecaea pedrosoi CBS 271.37]